jgi:hypothetical protein
VLIGNAGRNTLNGGAGDDIIVTVAGNAGIKPDAGFDRVDGGVGNDLLILGGFQSDYQVLNANGRSFLVTARGATDVTGIEQGAFSTTSAQSWSGLVASTAAFQGLSYIASYGDLRAAFGTNAAAGAAHFAEFGFGEGRSLSFNALEYIASYGDLRAVFGADATAGARHFIEFGATENRAATFDGWAYLASYGDLIKAYGANETAALQHFIMFGSAENRTTTFDALAYAAANPDLAAVFGVDTEALARHYVFYGNAEVVRYPKAAPYSHPVDCDGRCVIGVPTLRQKARQEDRGIFECPPGCDGPPAQFGSRCSSCTHMHSDPPVLE